MRGHAQMGLCTATFERLHQGLNQAGSSGSARTRAAHATGTHTHAAFSVNAPTARTLGLLQASEQCPHASPAPPPRPCSKFAINFDDGSKGRFFLQYEQWEPLDLDLLEQRQQAQRAAAQEAAAAVAAAAAATGAAAVGAPRQRAQRASALLPPGGYGSLLGEDAELEPAAPAAGQLLAPPPPVPGAASGLPPPASPQPRTVEQLPEPLPLSPEAEKARKVRACLLFVCCF